MTREVQYVRDQIRARERLVRHFGAVSFADPGLMILLHLFLAYEDGKTFSVKQTCVIAGVPNTTALRWISALESGGLVSRAGDTRDRRSVLVSLTAAGYEAVRAWIADVSPESLVG